MQYNSKGLPNLIAAFLNKHGGDRKRLTVNGYEFVINGIYDIDIPAESINVLPNESVQFNGNAHVNQHDTASGVKTNVKVVFHGVAFFAKDKSGDEIILQASIDQIKQVKQ